jgi:subtilisin family serine protease
MRLLASLGAGLALAAALAAPLLAAPGRISIGFGPEVSADTLAPLVAGATGGTLVHDLGPLEALVFAVPDVDAAVAAAATLPGVAYAEPVRASRTLAFTPNDPLAASQWYLGAIRAFDHWPARPPHPPVRVAVIDSGIDGGHPEFAGRIAAARSFVGGSALVDTQGHGTAVAGEIGAALDNENGIAGTGIAVELLVAKVVGRGGQISLDAEARAIRWAVDNGAQVVNLSLGGPRDPTDRSRDTYSRLEHAAVSYAIRRGAVVVAAAGNCARVRCPEPFAAWPAALPHVVGVGALRRDGTAPGFSNRDRLFVDLGAPGVDMLTTSPRPLAVRGCALAGYTVCAAAPARENPRGTSFAAPLVSAAAAVLLAERGLLGLSRPHASQVRALLARAATDVGRPGRDAAAGYGRVDVAAAVAAASGELPARDAFETNDDAGAAAWTLAARRRVVDATLDRFDDARDVYRLRLVRGRRLVLSLDGPEGGRSDLFLWRTGTTSVLGAARKRVNRLAASARPGSGERIAYRAKRTGWHFVEVRLAGGRSGAYRLTLAR